jgi:hypothetical protein
MRAQGGSYLLHQKLRRDIEVVVEVSPEPSILDAALCNQTEIFVDAIKDQRVSLPPNVPGDSSVDSPFIIVVWRLFHHEIVDLSAASVADLFAPSSSLRVTLEMLLGDDLFCAADADTFHKHSLGSFDGRSRPRSSFHCPLVAASERTKRCVILLFPSRYDPAKET